MRGTVLVGSGMALGGGVPYVIERQLDHEDLDGGSLPREPPSVVSAGWHRGTSGGQVVAVVGRAEAGNDVRRA